MKSHKAMIKRLKAQEAALAKERDKLQDLVEDALTLLDVNERACESLNDAIAALSEQV